MIIATLLLTGLLFQQPPPQLQPTAEQRLQLDLGLCSDTVTDLKEGVLKLQLELKRITDENAELKKKLKPPEPDPDKK